MIFKIKNINYIRRKKTRAHFLPKAFGHLKAFQRSPGPSFFYTCTPFSPYLAVQHVLLLLNDIVFANTIMWTKWITRHIEEFSCFLFNVVFVNLWALHGIIKNEFYWKWYFSTNSNGINTHRKNIFQFRCITNCDSQQKWFPIVSFWKTKFKYKIFIRYF